MADIAYFGRDKKSVPAPEIAYDSQVPAEVEDAFRSTTRIIFGSEHRGIKRFREWMLRRTIPMRKVKGAFGIPTYKVDGLPVIRDIPADRLVTLEEGMELSKKPIAIKKGETLPLAEALSRVSRVAYFSVEFVDGQNDNCVDTPSIFTGSNTYHVWDTTESKRSAYSAGVIRSEGIFGGYLRALQSQFCINCFDPTNLKRCFEVDSSYSCSDCYFCHNCENVSDSMFCSNLKAARYAICNTVVGKEEYLRVKAVLLSYINAQLEKNGSLSESIFNIPSKKRKAKSK
ncbi:Uncharacterised protein [uncultured archaeon]|nr:Uncharacterised protein [uncultured archaeon]